LKDKPVILQPMYYDKQTNKLAAFGKPITGNLGEELPLPPAALDVISSTNVIQTTTQIPIGGRGELEQIRVERK
jgi:hypothetical protein